MYMSNIIFEALRNLELLDESKQDILNFKDKFGEDIYDLFNRAKQRLKNNNHTTDIIYYTKNYTPEELKQLLLSLYDDTKDAQKKRIIKGEDKIIRGEYSDLGMIAGYHVYEPLDYLAAVDLGVNTGWCISGRYGHANHPDFTPDERAAKIHFDGYKNDLKFRMFIYVDPKTGYGEWAVVLRPDEDGHLKSYYVSDKNNNYFMSTCFIYDAQDKKDFSEAANLDLGKLCSERPIYIYSGEMVTDENGKSKFIYDKPDKGYRLRIS